MLPVLRPHLSNHPLFIDPRARAATTFHPMSPKTQSTRTPPTTPSHKGGARSTPRPSTPPRRWTTEAVGLPSSSSSSHLKPPTTPSRKSTKESAQPAPSTSQISLPKHTHTPGGSAVSLPFSTHSKASSAGGRDRPGLMGPRPSNHDLGSFNFEHRARTKSHSTLTPPRAVMKKINGMIKERDKADMEKELAKMKLVTDGKTNAEKRSSRPSSSIRRQSGA